MKRIVMLESVKVDDEWLEAHNVYDVFEPLFDQLISNGQALEIRDPTKICCVSIEHINKRCCAPWN